MSELSPEAAVSRIVSEFSRRGWRHENEVAASLVREILGSGGVPNPAKLAHLAPALFLSANKTTRPELRQALTDALRGVRIEHHAAKSATTNIYGDRVMGDKIQVNNKGQMAANIGGRRGQVRVESQQQLRLTASQERALREHIEDPEVQEALALPLPDDEKAQIVGGRLAKLANVVTDKAVDFAAKFIAEMVNRAGQ